MYNADPSSGDAAMSDSTLRHLGAVSVQSCCMSNNGVPCSRMYHRLHPAGPWRLNAQDTPVGVHFNQQGHEPRVRVLGSAPTNVIQRRILEATRIRHFKQQPMVTLLNRDGGADILALD